jgi:ubiquinone/menaquinone biosynthesis C-methylase UbiE
MRANLQRRIQRYGWDLAVYTYEAAWHRQLAPAQEQMLSAARLAPGEDVLDVACGTGLASFAAAAAVGATGRVLGVDISGQMIDTARRRASERCIANVEFHRMDAETLAIPDGGFDVALCALGLMYFPDPTRALQEMRRALRPGGRISVAVWGRRSHCGWAEVFPIVDAEVRSEVCPLFFDLGAQGALARTCVAAGFVDIEEHRIASTLVYANEEEACNAAFMAGPAALAWSRFDEETRRRVCERYVASIARWRAGTGFIIPGEFVIVSAQDAREGSRRPGDVSRD